jgi:hypothetical protein
MYVHMYVIVYSGIQSTRNRASKPEFACILDKVLNINVKQLHGYFKDLTQLPISRARLHYTCAFTYSGIT